MKEEEEIEKNPEKIAYTPNFESWKKALDNVRKTLNALSPLGGEQDVETAMNKNSKKLYGDLETKKKRETTHCSKRLEGHSYGCKTLDELFGGPKEKKTKTE